MIGAVIGLTLFSYAKERKDSGLAQAIEGSVTDDPIVAIDDLTNTSSSLEKVRVIAADLGKRVERAFVVVDYTMRPSLEWRRRHGIEVESLFNLRQFGLPLPQPPSAYRAKHRFEPLWSVAASGANQFIVAPNSQPVSDGKTVYVGTDGGELLALDAATGDRVWTFACAHTFRKGIRSSPVLAEGKVLFGAYNGIAYCLDASTGSEIWQAHEAEWVGSSPVVSRKHGLAIFGLEHERPSAKGSIAAFEFETGRKVWEHSVSEYIHSSPILSANDERLFVGTNGNDLLCLDTPSGTVVWQYWSKGAIKAPVALSESLGIVVAASHDKGVHLVRADTGRPIAIVQTAEKLFSTALIVGDVAFIGSPDKHVYVIDLIDGSVSKTFFLGSRIFATPTLLGGIVYVGTTSGKLFGIDPATLTLREVLQVPERIANAPILVQDGTILVVPTLCNRLFAFRAEGMVMTDTPPALPRDNVARLQGATDLFGDDRSSARRRAVFSDCGACWQARDAAVREYAKSPPARGGNIPDDACFQLPRFDPN